MTIQQNCGMVRFNEPWTTPIVIQKRHGIVSKFEIGNNALFAINKYNKQESHLTVACGIVTSDNKASCLLLYPQ